MRTVRAHFPAAPQLTEVSWRPTPAYHPAWGALPLPGHAPAGPGPLPCDYVSAGARGTQEAVTAWDDAGQHDIDTIRMRVTPRVHTYEIAENHRLHWEHPLA